jgi:3-oxoacyl-[acyl-carrier protein] reductase
MADFEGQTVLITGASRGIGAHLAADFRAEGAWVAACARSLEESEDAQGWSSSVDMTYEKQVHGWIRQVYKRRGGIDVLINNAGAASMNMALLTPTASARKALELNYLAAFSASREAAKVMRRKKYGRIINLTTVAVPMRIEGEMSYAASKAALEMATRFMAAEFAPWGITCNLVGPSPVDTDLIRGVGKERLEALLQRIPNKSMAQMEDVAYAIKVFARRESGQLTAQVLYLGGVA